MNTNSAAESAAAVEACEMVLSMIANGGGDVAGVRSAMAKSAAGELRR